jgi:hypothetical protein
MVSHTILAKVKIPTMHCPNLTNNEFSFSFSQHKSNVDIILPDYLSLHDYPILLALFQMIINADGRDFMGFVELSEAA